MQQILDVQYEVASLSGLRNLLVELGGDPAAINRRCRYDLDNPDKTLGYDLYSELLCAAAEETGCPHFGLLLGQRADVSLVGSLGLLTQYSSTVGEAFRLFIRYYNITSLGEILRLEVGPNTSMLIREPTVADLALCVQSQDVTLSEAHVITRKLRGENWRPSGVYLTHEPLDKGIYQSVFGCPVHFNQSVQGMSFASDELDQPLRTADKAKRRAVEELVAEMSQRLAKDFRQRVLDGIKLGMATGNCGVKQVAQYLAMHTRTLHRKLSKEGVTFSGLLEDTRRRLSYHLVSRTQLNILEISQNLGYSDATAFSRSFRRWFGISPAHWRRQHGG